MAFEEQLSRVGSLFHDLAALVSRDGADAKFPGAVYALAALPLLLLIKGIFFPSIGPREPPFLMPKVPFVGHIVSLMSEGTGYYTRLL